eukprot:10127246-Prorocentrum_lima.AAC.1
MCYPLVACKKIRKCCSGSEAGNFYSSCNQLSSTSSNKRFLAKGRSSRGDDVVDWKPISPGTDSGYRWQCRL